MRSRKIGTKEERRGDVSQRGYRLNGIHYSNAMKPMFTDKPASEHRRNVTTPNGQPLGTGFTFKL